MSDAVLLKDPSNRLRRVRLIELLTDRSVFGDAFRETSSVNLLALEWADATEEQKEGARSKASHVREMLTGYRSGSRAVAPPDEPRPEYDTTLRSLADRRRSKADELNTKMSNSRSKCPEVSVASSRTCQIPSEIPRRLRACRCLGFQSAPPRSIKTPAPGPCSSPGRTGRPDSARRSESAGP